MRTGIVVAVFSSRKVLIRALDHLLNEQDAIKVRRAAIVARAKTGETVVLGDDISPDEGGIAGGTLGAAVSALGIAQLGALALPGVGPVIALGAAVLVGGLVGGMTGRFAANLVDFGYRNEQVDALAARLEEGHPALVLELDSPDEALEYLRRELAPFRAELIEPLHRAAMNPPADDKEPGALV